MEQTDIASMFLYVLFGFILTSIMQSSSAAIVITLSAADSGLITLSTAAATVIGANLGTTTTAIIAVIGATSTAKRVAVSLALFHTVFNLLGVLLMLPISDRLVKFLQSRFIDSMEMAAKPLCLDKTSMEIPELAISALVKELAHLNNLVVTACIDAIGNQDGNTDLVEKEKNNIENLSAHIADNVAQLMQTGISQEVANVLPEIILNAQRSSMNIDNAIDVVEQIRQSNIGRQRGEVIGSINAFKQSAVNIIIMSADTVPASQQDTIMNDLASLEAEYDNIRHKILLAGVSGQFAMNSLDAQLTQLNLVRRVVRQSVKTFQHFRYVQDSIGKNDPNTSTDKSQIDTIV